MGEIYKNDDIRQCKHQCFREKVTGTLYRDYMHVHRTYKTCMVWPAAW